jgi:hypothetical protein
MEILSNKLRLVDPGEIDIAEQQFREKMPLGYREFLTQVGKGKYCTWIEVFLPQSVIQISQE